MSTMPDKPAADETLRMLRAAARRVHVAERALEREMRARDDFVALAAAQGATIRLIADASGLRKSRVGSIVANRRQA